jgi:flagellar L-ring protein FlgH
MKTRFKSFSRSALGAMTLICSLAAVQGDSLWTREYSVSIIADKKANAIGDIITVVVQEANTTKKDSSTKTAKSTELDASLSSFLFSPAASGLLTKKGKLPAMNLSSKHDFDGGGQINNSESILARFGVRVVDVLPNGNLIVEGLRQTSFSDESQTVILRGTVRPYDISPGNTVFSYSLADVSIKFQSSGAVSNTQKKGWFTRAWEVLTPF